MKQKNKWYEYCFQRINNNYVQHICNKCNIKGSILEYPNHNDLTDTYEFGIIQISNINKKFKKYQILLEHNNYILICNDKFISPLAYMGIYINEKYKKYL